MNLSKSIESASPQKGELSIFWLGQAGFLLKDSSGKTLAVDPYLTDCGERIKNYTGFKRISPKLISPDELAPDYYLITHTHFDHYDFDAVPQIAKNGKTLFIGPTSCAMQLKKDGVPEACIVTLNRGDVFERDGLKITATVADHGEMAPDAIGAVVRMGGKTVYFSGDTSYHPEYAPELAAFKPDAAVLSINGAFGNLNAEEGAKLACDIGAKIAIPCHFWTFVEHGGDPLLFKKLLDESNTCSAKFLSQGEMLII